MGVTTVSLRSIPDRLSATPRVSILLAYAAKCSLRLYCNEESSAVSPASRGSPSNATPDSMPHLILRVMHTRPGSTYPPQTGENVRQFLSRWNQLVHPYSPDPPAVTRDNLLRTGRGLITPRTSDSRRSPPEGPAQRRCQPGERGEGLGKVVFLYGVCCYI